MVEALGVLDVLIEEVVRAHVERYSDVIHADCIPMSSLDSDSLEHELIWCEKP